jgi:hypothetical protein
MVSFPSDAQIEQLIIEKYYISDNKDATDTDGGYLETGSVTYRIFADLSEGCKLKSIFGNQYHPLQFNSTEGFFNNLDRGNVFGFRIGANRLVNNTTALDSWLTIGYATNLHTALEKPDDSDGSVVGGSHNDGGSAGINGGLLVNNDPLAGIPLTTSDGLIITGTVLQFIDYGISDTSIFGSTFKTSFTTTNASLNVNGISGPTPENKILIAQLTTKGSISFKINLGIIKNDGAMINYVADNQNLAPDERYSKWLSYPFTTGCTDPYFLEFNPESIIDDGSCNTPIVLGCTDPKACNYDHAANFNVPELCCYGPDSCDNRDIKIVCPDFRETRKSLDFANYPEISVYPNPAENNFSVEFISGSGKEVRIELYDATGKKVLTRQYKNTEPGQKMDLELQGLRNGIYSLNLFTDGYLISKKLVKY